MNDAGARLRRCSRFGIGIALLILQVESNEANAFALTTSVSPFLTDEAVRGMTIGPIESALQPGRGYGSAAFETTLDELEQLGVNWVSLTVFGRVLDLKSTGVSVSFEAPLEQNQKNVCRAVALAHERGFKVMLVPHLWVESHGWRAELDPGGEAGWSSWEASYGRYVKGWARVAERCGIDLLAAGVELRFWVTSSRAPTFVLLLKELRDLYSGPLTYAANWDDAPDTVIWRDLDVIGVNGFYPLHWEKAPTDRQISQGAMRAAREVESLAQNWDRPVIFTEFGYTAREDTMVEPWLWPEELEGVERHEADQARAYAALLQEIRHAKGFLGAFVWRMYADVADLSQEPDWAFSPWGKRAEAVLGTAFASRFSSDSSSMPRHRYRLKQRVGTAHDAQ